MSANLFKPIRVGAITTGNRVVLSPMTRLRSPNNVPDDLVAEYYGQRAQAPGTLIITEATGIRPEALGFPNAPGIWSDEQQAAWSKVFKAIHEKKSFVFQQLWALGRASKEDVLDQQGYDYVSSSDVQLEEGHSRPPRPLSKDEIKQYVQWYAQAAKRSIAAGADGVEIHGAYGYLPEQFLRANINKRTDEYGGSIENRSRFVLEILDALIEAVGPEQVGIRLSPWGAYQGAEVDTNTTAQYTYLVGEIERRAQEGKRIAFIELLEARTDEHPGRDDLDVLNNVFYNIWKGPILRSTNMTNVAKEIAGDNDRTLISIGRAFTSNPDIVEKLRDGKALRAYDRSKFYWDGKSPLAEGYTDYPNN